METHNLLKLERKETSVNSRPNVLYLIRLALAQAPDKVHATFQRAFLTFAQVLLKQRQLSNTTFPSDATFALDESSDSFEKVCAVWNLDRQSVDPDRIVWLPHETCTKFFIRPGQWVNICLFCGSSSKRTRSNLEENHFTCQILPIPSSLVSGKKCSSAVLSMNPVTEYNLRRALNIQPLVSLPALQLKLLVTDPVVKTLHKNVIFSPIPAKSVKLARLRSSHEICDKDCDILIQDKFLLNDKYLCVGDIVSCSVTSHVNLDFIVLGINDKQLEQSGFRELCRVSSEFTKMVVNPGEWYNQFHVRATQRQMTRLLAPCLHRHFTKLKDWMHQALAVNRADLWPHFLTYGPIGGGKTTVCQAVAAFYGLNFHFVNGVNLIGDTSAYTEGKLKALYDQIKNSLCPALMFLKNVHFIGKDKDGNEDKRVILAFQEFLLDIAALSVTKTDDQSDTLNSRAVFIVGTTNLSDLLIPSVAQNFLLKLEFPAVINSLTETGETLKWLLEKNGVNLENGTNFEAWVKENCSGIKKCYVDLKALTANVVRCAFNRTVNSDEKNVTVNFEDLNHGLQTIDAILKKSASTVEVPKVTWADIGGLEDIKKELINSVRLPLEYPHLFASGIRRSGILLYGPPGTGKTLIAKAVATEFQLSFLSVKGPELLNMYVGQSEQNVRNVFDKARGASPCIVFFDELDALAPNRGRAGDSGGVMDRVVSQILAELDGTHSTPEVFIIGATNRPDLIDPALLRPGRFDKLLYVGITQDISSKTKVLKALTRKFHLSDDVDLEKVAGFLPIGMSGADLYSLCSDTYMTAVERLISEQSDDQGKQSEKQDSKESNEDYPNVMICMSDFVTAISRVTTSLSEEDQQRYDRLKRMMS